MNDNSFEIIERVCMTDPAHQHYLLMQARAAKTGETVWIVGDDQVCAITRADFLRNPDLDYNDVLIREFSYKEHSPESVGNWRSLIEELVKFTLEKYREHDGLVHVYPQWVPAEVSLPLPREKLFRGAAHIIFYQDGAMEIIPHAADPGSEVPGHACGKEEC